MTTQPTTTPVLKKWKHSAWDSKGEVTLYTFTDDQAIQCDLNAGQSSSLILFVRKFATRAETTNDADHMDLASGAFTAHMTARGYRPKGPMVLTDMIPSGLTSFPLGGKGGSVGGDGSYAVTVYEDREIVL